MATSSLGVVSGIAGRIAVSGTAINLEYWEAEEIVDTGNSTNFESVIGTGASGTAIMAKENFTGVGYVRWSIRGKWDSAHSQFGSPPSLQIGILVAPVLFLASKTLVAGYSFTALLIQRTKVTVNAQQGAVTYEASGESQGSWIRNL